MIGALPLRINPLRLAEQGASIAGTVSLKDMQRLCDTLLPQRGEAQVVLHFTRDHDGVSTVDGKLRASVEMQCQRCLRPMTKMMDRSFRLALACGEREAARLQADYEVLELESEMIATRDLVEDELLLSVPLVPLHEDPAACDVVMMEKLAGGSDAAGEPTALRATSNPFAVLEKLRKS